MHYFAFANRLIDGCNACRSTWRTAARVSVLALARSSSGILIVFDPAGQVGRIEPVDSCGNNRKLLGAKHSRRLQALPSGGGSSGDGFVDEMTLSRIRSRAGFKHPTVAAVVVAGSLNDSRWRTACPDHRRRPAAATTPRTSPPGTCRTQQHPGVVAKAPGAASLRLSTCSAGSGSRGPLSIRRGASNGPSRGRPPPDPGSCLPCRASLAVVRAHNR